jgi:WD40 repeat protein
MQVRLFSAASRKKRLVAVLDYHTAQVTDVRWRPEGSGGAARVLASASRDRAVAIWEPLEQQD